MSKALQTQPERHYRLIFTKDGSDYKRRIAFSYLDRATGRAAQLMVLGALEYQIVQIVKLPNGIKKDGVALCGGSREGGTMSFTVSRHAATIVKRESPPLWWPSWAMKKGNGKAGE